MAVSCLLALFTIFSHFAFQVYYDVETQKATLRKEVKNSAYNAAKVLTKVVCGPWIYIFFLDRSTDLFYAYFQNKISTDEELKTALETYASSQWTHEFGYTYDSPKPKDYEGGAAATLVRNRALKYLQEADAAATRIRINHFITDEFFQLSALSYNSVGQKTDLDLGVSIQTQTVQVREMTRK